MAGGIIGLFRLDDHGGNRAKIPFKSDQSVLILQGLLLDVVENLVVTPHEFGDVEEIAPALRGIEELL